MSSEIPETSNTAWYVVHTKPRQEARALENLENQGFKCYLPVLQIQKLRNQRVQTVTEPMFSRYLFIQLDDQTQNWGPIRSTLGVSKLVSFGPQPAKVPAEFIAFLQEAPAEAIKHMFAPGESVRVVSGPLRGLEGEYAGHEGETRAYVLLEFLGQSQRLCMMIENLRAA